MRIQNDIRICVLLYRLHHCGGFVVNKQQQQPNDPYWPFPSQCPPKPWTPEEVKQYEKLQRAKVPDAPMVSNHS